MQHMLSLEELNLKANAIRQDIIKMLEHAGSGHSAGPLGLADIFTALYFDILKHDPKNPDWDERDMLLQSNGHTCPVRYATMAHAGYFDRKELLTLRKFGSRLQGHPERTKLPGLENTSGPLVVSSPGNRTRSGWPCKREPSWRSVSNSSFGK